MRHVLAVVLDQQAAGFAAHTAVGLTRHAVIQHCNAALGFALVMAGLLIGVYYYVAPGLPQAAELRDIKIQLPLQVYSRDGRLIDEFGEQKRTPVAYEHIPPLLIKAEFADQKLNRTFGLTVIVNHLKSYRGIDDEKDGDRVRNNSLQHSW